jgi:hypothetical protein
MSNLLWNKVGQLSQHFFWHNRSSSVDKNLDGSLSKTCCKYCAQFSATDLDLEALIRTHDQAQLPVNIKCKPASSINYNNIGTEAQSHARIILHHQNGVQQGRLI